MNTKVTVFLSILERERDRTVNVIFRIFQTVDHDQHERSMPRNVRVRRSDALKFIVENVHGFKIERNTVFFYFESFHKLTNFSLIKYIFLLAVI